MPQVFDVEVRPHPWGEKGVRSSLDETAKRAAKGAIRPEVRTWAIECLDRERKRGGKVNSDWDRARVLLKACQDKLWVPDPVFAEYIPPAHLLACEKHGDNGNVCIKGEDCDGLVVLFGAACMSVGLHVIITGHAYNQAKQIQHVLTMVRINGKWHYADPSTPEHIPAFPLGKCHPPTRERLLSVPNVQVLCDGQHCMVDPTKYDPDRSDFVVEGVFVGLDGIPEPQLALEDRALNIRWLEEPKIRWLGAAEEVSTQEPIPPPGYSQTPQVIVVKEPADKEAPPQKMSITDKLLAASVVISALGLLFEYTRKTRRTR